MRGKDLKSLVALLLVLSALLAIFFLVKLGAWKEMLGVRPDGGKVRAFSQRPRIALGGSQSPRVALGGPIENVENFIEGYGTRKGAVAYAKRFWNRTASCGYGYHLDGGDCAHFVSHCLIAGGLDTRGHGKGWKGDEKVFVGCPRLYLWLVPHYGKVVKSVRELEPGDVIFYGSGRDHVTLYIGGGEIAEHSPSSWGKHYREDGRKVTLVHVRYPQ